jgi:hypothetical protein
MVAYLITEKGRNALRANKLASGGNRQALTPCCFPVRVTHPPLLLHPQRMNEPIVEGTVL